MNDGFTLIELIIGGVVSLMVISVTLGIVVEQRKLFLTDQARINANQNLRIASDFMGTDLKQVGERTQSDTKLPVIRLISGTGTNPDALILQRQLIWETLLICENVETNDTDIVVADEATNCNYSDNPEEGPDGEIEEETDNLTDALGGFKSYRCQLEEKSSCAYGNDDSVTPSPARTIANCDDECVYAYIYDPAEKRGEFFLYVDEIYETETDSGDIKNKIKIIPLAGNDLRFSYDKTTNPEEGPVIYILEEKKYGLCDGVLQLTTNQTPNSDGEYNDCPYADADPKPVRLVDSLADFQVRVQTDAGWVTTFNDNLNNLTDFSEVKSIEVSLETEADANISTDTNTLSLTTEFFPRNAKSSF